MVRVGGMNYTCDPKGSAGNRISEMTTDAGQQIQANKNYSVAGWATVGSQSPGAPIWDVVAEYLRDQKSGVVINTLNTPKLLNVKGNPGIAS